MTIASQNTSLQPSPIAEPQFRRAQFWIFVAVVGATGLLRLLFAAGDFRISEIASWKIARDISSVPQILTDKSAQVDDNHPLNTFVLRIMGDRSFWAIYRTFSLITGIWTVVLAGRLMLRFGKTAALIAAILLGISYPLITYSAQAVGFAPMVFFALVAFRSMQKFLQQPGWRSGVIFSLASILGFLSHVSFVQFYIAILAWSIYERTSRGQKISDVAPGLFALHAAPLLFLISYLLVFVRYLPPAAATTSAGTTILDTLAMLIGAQPGFAVGAYLAVLGAVAIIAALDWIGAARTDDLVFFVLMLIVGPAVQLLLIRRPAPVSPGYFLLPLTFALMLFAVRLGAMFNARGTDRIIAVTIIALMIVGNLWQIARYMIDLPAHYYDAITYVSDRTTERPQVTVVARSSRPGDIQRIQDTLAFYARYLPEGKRYMYDQAVPPLPAPQWLIINTYGNNAYGGGNAALPPKIDLSVVGRGIVYSLDHEFSYYGLGGSSWQIYRLEVPQ